MSPKKWIEWYKRVAVGRPVLFSILVFLAAGLVTEIPLQGVLWPWVGYPAAKFWEGIVEHVLVGLAVVGLIVKLGLFDRAGFTPPRQWKALWLVWPLAVITLVNLEPLLDGSLVLDVSRPGLIVLYLCLALAIGFCEETLGRGFILPLLLQKWGATRRGIYLAVLVSSAIFGLSHLFNLVLGRKLLLPGLTQLVYSFFFGVILAACFLRNNSIWPAIVMHAAVDLGGSLLRTIAVGGGPPAVANSTLVGAATSIAITLFLFLYGLFILRKVAPATAPGGEGSAQLYAKG